MAADLFRLAVHLAGDSAFAATARSHGIGRLKSIPDSKKNGKDNAIWALFDRPDDRATIRFIGRNPKQRKRR